MYALRSALIGRPVVSLQTGQVVGHLERPVLELATLEVVGLSCRVTSARYPQIILATDIRQYAADCIIIGSEDDLTDPSDLVRDDSSLKSQYSPLGQTVITDSGRKLGLVEDYVLNLETQCLQKLHVRKSLIQAWLGASPLLIDRTQITDITPHQITVRDAFITNPLPATDSLSEI